MPQNPCAIPPGREWAVTNCEPEIPGPIWDDYIGGKGWPAGIAKGLRETSGCGYVNRRVHVKRGPSLETIAGQSIAGFFPWGWYKVCPETPDTRPPAPPTDWIASQDPAVAREVEGLALSPFLNVGTVADDPVSGGDPPAPDCMPVPSVDCLVPYPLTDGWIQFAIGGKVSPQFVRAGAFGVSVYRIPGSDHPLFSSGFGLEFLAREFLAAPGLAWLMGWDAWANGQSKVNAGTYAGQEMVRITRMFSSTTLGGGGAASRAIDPEWWLRDFAASHIQIPCSPLRFCSGPAESAAGVAGKPMRARWRVGGASPAPYIGDGYDSLEAEGQLTRDESGAVKVAAGVWIPVPGPSCDSTGARRDVRSPEFGGNADPGMPFYQLPIVMRYTFSKGVRSSSRWGGPAPGTFA